MNVNCLIKSVRNHFIALPNKRQHISAIFQYIAIIIVGYCLNGNESASTKIHVGNKVMLSNEWLRFKTRSDFILVVVFVFYVCSQDNKQHFECKWNTIETKGNKKKRNTIHFYCMRCVFIEKLSHLLFVRSFYVKSIFFLLLSLSSHSFVHPYIYFFSIHNFIHLKCYWHTASRILLLL